MQEARPVTISSNITIKRPSDMSEDGPEAETHGPSSGISPLSSLQQPHGTDLLSLDQMKQEDFMLIRIRRHDNKCKETQVAVPEVIITIVFTISKACYMDKKPAFRIICGSIYLMLAAAYLAN